MEPDVLKGGKGENKMYLKNLVLRAINKKKL